MEFIFRKGEIIKVEGFIRTKISKEEYEALTSPQIKKDWTVPPAKTTPVTENGQDFLEEE